MAGEPDAVSEAPQLVCAYHPQRETLLRCARCDKPICTQCAIRHPVGLRCRECARLTRLPTYRVGPRALGLGLLGGLAAGVAGAFVLQLIPGIFFSLILSPVVGGFVGEAVYRSSGGKRGREMMIVAGAAVVLGALGALLLPLALTRPERLVPALGSGRLYATLLTNPVMLLYFLLGIGAASARLR